MPTIFRSIQQRDFALPSNPLIATAIALAFWPLATWYASRFSDYADDPLGILALLTAVIIGWRHRSRLELSSSGCWWAAAIIALELVFQPWLPPLLEGALFVLALSIAFALPQRAPGLAALLLLSLPMIASMQFFLGYPLRWLTATLTHSIMHLFGCDIRQLSTDLMWHGAQVGVDPPCSGVRMLWIACFVAATLSAWSSLRPLRVLVLGIASVAIVVVANAARAALLLPGEAGVIQPFASMHELVGIGVMTPSFWLLVRLHDRLALSSSTSPTQHIRPSQSFSIVALLGVALASAIMQLVNRHDAWAAASPLNPKWPATFEGKALEPLPLTSREIAFSQTMPGHLARFRMGSSELILRRVSRATRQLHSSGECLRAIGYEVSAPRAFHDDSGASWCRFFATRSNQTLEVRERIIDDHGRQWCDVSSWFWSALFHPSDGPWLFATVITDQPPALTHLRSRS